MLRALRRSVFLSILVAATRPVKQMSSFRRRVPAGSEESQAPTAPQGTRIVPQTGQFVISSGVSSLDDVVGGGFPLGSLVLIKTDRGTAYGNLLLRYFAAQGFVDRHASVFVAGDGDPEVVLKSLPKPLDGSAAGSVGAGRSQEDDDEDDDEEGQGLTTGQQQEKSDDLKIAWRYKPVAAFSTAVKADGSGRKAGWCSSV